MNIHNRNSINDFLKYQKIAKQLSNTLINETSIEQHPELSEFMSDEKNINRLIHRLRDCEQAEQIYQNIDKKNRGADVYRLIGKLEKRKRIRARIKIAVFASAAALIALSFLIYTGKNNNNISIVEPATISDNTTHYTDVPVLIYDNSKEQIILNKLDNLSIKGDNIAKVDDKRLEYIPNRTDTVLFATLMIPYKAKYTVILPDGSEVYLNANSKLRYPSKFDNERNVELTGEAFFKVTKNKTPFKVKIGGVEVKVYGTEFNVMAYSPDKIVTTLLEGSVGVKYDCQDKSVETIIKPNERITINTQTGKKNIEENINTAKYKSWQNNYFRQDEEPLEVLLEALSNWYGVEFIYQNEAIRNKTISASLENSMDIDNILEMLELSSKIKFIKKGGKYVVK